MEKFYDKVKNISDKLSDSGFENYGRKLADLIIEGGTVGEKFVGVANELNKLKSQNHDIYLIAQSEIDEIINYAKSIGYL